MPTAWHDVAEAHDTLSRTLDSVPTGATLVTDQTVPFHDATRACFSPPASS